MHRITICTIAIAIAASAVSSAQPDGSSFALISHKRLTTTQKKLRTQSKRGDGVPMRDHESLQFKKSDETIVVWTGPDDDMLSYRIQGKRNPTLIVKPGAVLHILFANTDDDMFHDMRFGSSKPPFGATPSIDGTFGTEQLPHQTETSIYADSITLKVPTQSGTYTYFCSMKGHAKGGMFGQLVVR
jgi:rusticyanin